MNNYYLIHGFIDNKILKKENNIFMELKREAS